MPITRPRRQSSESTRVDRRRRSLLLLRPVGVANSHLSSFHTRQTSSSSLHLSALFSPPPLPPPPQALLAARRRDSPVLVSPLSIPRRGSFPSSSSTRSPPHPASSPPLQGRRRAPPPAAAQRRRAGRSSPFPDVRVAGEVRRLLLVAVRTLSPLRPAGPASSRRPALAAPPPLSPRACARASRRAVAAPTPRSRHRPCLDPACRPLGWPDPGGSSNFARVSLGFICL